MIANRIDGENQIIDAEIWPGIVYVLDASFDADDDFDADGKVLTSAMNEFAEAHVNWQFFNDQAALIDQPVSLYTSGSAVTELGFKLLEDTMNHAQTLRIELRGLDEARLHARYLSSVRSGKGRFKNLRDKRGSQRDRWEFFNNPRSDADFVQWLLLPYWTPEEAVALSLGKDPKRVTEEAMAGYRTIYGSPFADEYYRRSELVERAVSAGDLEAATRPRDFMTWASDIVLLSLPDELRLACAPSPKDTVILALQAEIEALKKDRLKRTPSAAAKHLNSLYRVVLAMAIRNYGYIYDGNDSAAKMISADCFDANRIYYTYMPKGDSYIFKNEISTGNDLNITDDAVRATLGRAATSLDFLWSKEMSTKLPRKR